MAKNINRLRVLRAGIPISQLDLAEKTGIGMNRFWRIENGYIEPTEDERVTLATFFGVSIEDVFPSRESQAVA